MRAGFFAVIFLGDDRTRALNEQLAAQIIDYGGRCAIIGSGITSSGDGLLPLDIPASSDDLLPIAEILPVQLMTIPLAQQRGFEPAQFEHASKITRHEG